MSDREARASLPDTQPMLELAENMIKDGKAEELMPREASPEAPITAYRYLAETGNKCCLLTFMYIIKDILNNYRILTGPS